MNHRKYKKMMRTTVSPNAFRLLFHRGYVASMDAQMNQYLDGHYVLEGEIFRKATSYSQWALHQEMFDTHKRIAQNFFARDTVRVSTVFLGFDHGFNSKTPLLFESMIFIANGRLAGHDIDETQERYFTYEAAMTGHRVLCELVKTKLEDMNNELRII